MNYEQLREDTFDLVTDILNETMELKTVQYTENINEALIDGTLSQKGFRAMSALELRSSMLADIQESLIDWFVSCKIDCEIAWKQTIDLVRKFQLEMFGRKTDQYVANFKERCENGTVSRESLRAIKELEMNWDDLQDIFDSLLDR